MEAFGILTLRFTHILRVIFGYEDAQQKKLVVVEAGDSGRKCLSV
jgi:hypothetical protein